MSHSKVRERHRRIRATQSQFDDWERLICRRLRFDLDSPQLKERRYLPSQSLCNGDFREKPRLLLPRFGNLKLAAWLRSKVAAIPSIVWLLAFSPEPDCYRFFMSFRIVVTVVTLLMAGGSLSQGADETVALEAFESDTLSLFKHDDAVTIMADRSQSLIVLIGYCAAIMAASVGGGWLPSIFRLTHTRMQTTISFVGGLMLGIAVFHLLPHSVHGDNSIDDSAWWMMAGILTMFLLIRCFHFHHHGPLEISTAQEDPCAGHDSHDHDHKRSSQALPVIGQPYCHHAHQLSWLGIAIGLSLHTLIDGIALAASVEADAKYPSQMVFYGLGTFLAIMLHKPLDAVSITSLMAGSGWKSRSRFLVNLIFATMCPIGAALFVLGIRQFSGMQDTVVCAVVAFSAGVFLCIALSDLLPEMEFHSHNRFRLTVALTAGVLLAYGITFLEPPHLH